MCIVAQAIDYQAIIWFPMDMQGGYMWPKKLPPGSWNDCLDAIENELGALKRIRSESRDSNAFQEKLTRHEMKNRFDLIWRYAGKAVKDLE